MKEIKEIYQLQKLKGVARLTEVKGRKESSAEHTWSCMILAEYFFKKISCEINEARVLKLLLFHDVIEIDAGDIPELHNLRKDKKKIESKALKTLKEKLPLDLYADFQKYFNEFEDGETAEAKFARAIDKLEPMIHQLDHKSDWKKYGYTEEVLWDKKGIHMQDFPVLLDFYNKYIEFLKAEAYID